MPNRVIRENILTSDRVNLLSWPAEVFYRRLMSIVDDYGRYDGRVSVLRGQLFPLRLNKVTESDLTKWMGECSKAGLVRFYAVENKPYLEITNFGQTIRIKKQKYPPCKQMQADASRCMSESNPIQSNPDSEKKPDKEADFIPPESEFLDYCREVLKDKYDALEFALKAKYDSWVDAKWKDGYGRPIKNWKTKIKNVLPHLRPMLPKALNQSTPKVIPLVKINPETGGIAK